MKSFKNNHEITLPFGLAFAQLVIIKLFDLGFLPRLLSLEPGCREFQLRWWLLVGVCHNQALSFQCCVKGCEGLEVGMSC